MPHAIIEYAAPLQTSIPVTDLVARVHDTLKDSGIFSAADVKTRAYACENYIVGETGMHGTFIHVLVYLLEGRSVAQRSGLSEALRDKLVGDYSQVDSISVDIRELEREVYRKHLRA